MSTSNNQPDLIAFVTVEQGEKTIYQPIGAAWKNSAGGYGIKLNSLPINGEIVLFPPKEKESED